MKVNSTGVKASSGFKPIPVGIYDARVYDIEVKETAPKEGEVQVASDGTQAKYLNVQYILTDEDYEGRYLWGITSIRFPEDPENDSEKERIVREMFIGWLNSVTGEDWADTEKDLDLVDLKGKKVRLSVGQKPGFRDPNQIQNNIKSVLPFEAKANGQFKRSV